MAEALLERQIKAIANRSRLDILHWLKDPCAHFAPQTDGDLIADGVCAARIEEKLELAQPTTAQHLRVLVDATLIVAKRKRQWTYYKRNEEAIAQLHKSLSRRL